MYKTLLKVHRERRAAVGGDSSAADQKLLTELKKRVSLALAAKVPLDSMTKAQAKELVQELKQATQAIRLKERKQATGKINTAVNL